MGLFGPSKGSVNAAVSAKIEAGKQHGGGAASQVQARQAKDRSKQIKEERKRKKQERDDIRRAKLLSVNGPPNAGRSKKFNEKAIKKGNKRRLEKEIKKAQRKARGFWG